MNFLKSNNVVNNTKLIKHETPDSMQDYVIEIDDEDLNALNLDEASDVNSPTNYYNSNFL